MSDRRAASRQWAADHAAVAARQRAELREQPPSRDLVVRQSLALIDLAADLHGWPLPDDPVRQREVDEARAAWARVRRRPAPPSEP